MSSDQLYNNLLVQGKKGAQSYQKKVQQIESQIQILKNKNNMLQKQSDNDIDDNDIKKQIYQQSQFVQIEITKIKKMLEEFSKMFKEPAAKNKLKDMWKSASKQIQRNKIITERIVNDAPRESFMNKEDRMRSSLLEGKNRKSKNYGHRSRDSQDIFRQVNRKQPTSPTKQATEQAYDDSELFFQNRIQKQKNQLLTHLQHKNMKINKVMNEIALMVDEQGQNINQITDNINQAHQNVESANQQLTDANLQQKKARKKYCILAIVLIILAISVVGVVLILSNNSSNNSDGKKE